MIADVIAIALAVSSEYSCSNPISLKSILMRSLGELRFGGICPSGS
jgi:hypothetical protein